MLQLSNLLLVDADVALAVLAFVISTSPEKQSHKQLHGRLSYTNRKVVDGHI